MPFVTFMEKKHCESPLRGKIILVILHGCCEKSHRENLFDVL